MTNLSTITPEQFAAFGRELWLTLSEDPDFYSHDFYDEIVSIAGKHGMAERVEFDPEGEHKGLSGLEDYEAGVMVWLFRNAAP